MAKKVKALDSIVYSMEYIINWLACVVEYFNGNSETEKEFKKPDGYKNINTSAVAIAKK